MRQVHNECSALKSDASSEGICRTYLASLCRCTLTLRPRYIVFETYRSGHSFTLKPPVIVSAQNPPRYQPSGTNKQATLNSSPSSSPLRFPNSLTLASTKVSPTSHGSVAEVPTTLLHTNQSREATHKLGPDPVSFCHFRAVHRFQARNQLSQRSASKFSLFSQSTSYTRAANHQAVSHRRCVFHLSAICTCEARITSSCLPVLLL